MAVMEPEEPREEEPEESDFDELDDDELDEEEDDDALLEQRRRAAEAPGRG
jgi:hypothetical protein